MNVTIRSADVEATLGKMALLLRDTTRINTALAAGALPVVQRRLRELATSNKNPFGARGGFWKLMLAGTIPVASADMAAIRMPQPMALRFFGGTVTPKKGKYLAIPARTESYGKSARDFDDLEFRPTARGGMLVRRLQTQLTFRRNVKTGQRAIVRKGKKAPREVGGEVYYWLVREATVKGDPYVLPEPGQIMEGALKGVRTLINLSTRS